MALLVKNLVDTDNTLIAANLCETFCLVGEGNPIVFPGISEHHAPFIKFLRLQNVYITGDTFARELQYCSDLEELHMERVFVEGSFDPQVYLPKLKAYYFDMKVSTEVLYDRILNLQEEHGRRSYLPTKVPVALPTPMCSGDEVLNNNLQEGAAAAVHETTSETSESIHGEEEVGEFRQESQEETQQIGRASCRERV